MGRAGRVERRAMRSVAVAVAVVLGGAAGPSWGQEKPAATSDLKPVAGVSVREGYDSNVYLQNSGDLSGRGSWVTTVTPSLGAVWTPHVEPVANADGMGASAGVPLTLSVVYNPIRTQFHNEPGESHWDHRVNADVTLNAGRWAVTMSNLFREIDGAHVMPLYLEPGGLAAAGAPAVRDRRDQTLYRGTLKAQYTAETWFFRPIATGYVQDFHIDHLQELGYCNFVDRSDVNVGADAGWKVMPDTFATLGYRVGHQSQDTIFDSPVQYANDYQRVLAGVEGRPAKWVKLAVQAGPDFRSFNDDVPETFDRRQVSFYCDASVTVTPTELGEVTGSVKRFEQPGAGGRSVYFDTTFCLTYKRKLTKSLTWTLGGKAYNTDFEYPAKKRDDWVYTAETGLAYKLDAHWTLEAGALYEAGRSEVPDTPGREYDRTMVYVGMGWGY